MQVQTSTKVSLDGYLSEPTEIEFPTTNGEVAFANFYPPKNEGFIAPEGSLPPVLVKLHGGPTAKSFAQLKFTTQFYTRSADFVRSSNQQSL
jgi:dipeptidyl aminopeptidase/acylaminoacyl peptidase